MLKIWAKQRVSHAAQMTIPVECSKYLCSTIDCLKQPVEKNSRCSEEHKKILSN